MFGLQPPRHIPTLHYPEAFEGTNEFRSLRCSGPVLLTASSSLHDPEQTWGVHAAL